MGKQRIGLIERAALVGLAVVMAVVTVACGSSGDDDGSSSGGGGGGDSASGSSRGFDGETITLGGLGNGANFHDADVGAQARFQRFNESGELEGVRIEYVGFADDRQDPATATSEARRLVTQEQVFAIVPDLSAVNPGDYLAEQQVPHVGMALDGTYCTQEPDDSKWGFGYNGCLVPEDPPVMPNSFRNLYDYVSEETGSDRPTLAVFSSDIEAGQNAARQQAVSAGGAGFDVVYAEGAVPITTSDYSPYVQAWMSADGGDAPDAVVCLMAVQCIDAWAGMKAAGFEGTFQTPLFSDLLLEPLEGTVASAFYNTEANEGLAQLQEDLEAFEPGTEVSSTITWAYFAADMFIEAVKAAAPDITPESVQRVLASQTWGIEGFVGPIEYPASTVVPTPSCNSLLMDTGTEWSVLRPYSCSDEQFEVEG